MQLAIRRRRGRSRQQLQHLDKNLASRYAASVRAANSIGTTFIKARGVTIWWWQCWHLTNRILTGYGNSAEDSLRFVFETPEGLAVDDRAARFFFTLGAPEEQSVTTLKVGYDETGRPLGGENSYLLHIPAKVPASQFWSVNAYDLETACFIRQSARVGISSFEQPQTNADGSVDVYLGPQSPIGKESNWLPTEEGKDYMLLFRFYGPEESLLDTSWKLNDIVEVK